MKIDFKKLIIGVLAFSVLLVAFSLVYYYTYFLPQKESMRLEFEKEKEIKQLELEIKQVELEEQKQKQLQEQLEKEREELGECLKHAHDLYVDLWDRECEDLGKEKGCRLPSGLAERADKLYKEERENCFKKYPQD